MKKFICIIVETKTKADVKEYELNASDKWDALYQAREQYKTASHYTPRLPPLSEVVFDLVDI